MSRRVFQNASKMSFLNRGERSERRELCASLAFNFNPSNCNSESDCSDRLFRDTVIGADVEYQ